mmetsp:Transcript_33373/g.32429  ORF Transcript_33373/g.32429 Transcript_33373/m.32429 type:complete len:174 (+) Transcript_33373:526-1047(+)
MVDMIPFLIVLIVAFLGFSITYAAIKVDEIDDTVDGMVHTYYLAYADFSYDNYNTFGWFLYIIASLLIALIMLNALIAIMSDTYARVMSEIIPSDFYELNNLILEQEEILFWKRNSGRAKNLHFAHYMERNEDEDWEGAYGGLKQQHEGRDEVRCLEKKFNKKLELFMENQAL